MRKVYKYRANTTLLSNKNKRDVSLLFDNLFYASNLRKQNDPFEGSVELPMDEICERWVTPLIQDLYNVGIYSLSKPKDGDTFPNNELLWAHYANSHQGFCIEYDLDLLLDYKSTNFDMSDVINVDYQEERPKYEETDNVLQLRKKVFGTKSLAWEYENEIRLVFSKDGLKPIAEGAITAIYLGLNISFKDRQEIIKTFADKKIDIYQVERIDNLYKLKASKLMFDYSYEIVSLKEMPRIDNYMILYKSSNKDKHSLREFVLQFRKKLKRPSNITIIDDIRVRDNLLVYKPHEQMTPKEWELQSKHWIAYSSFDAPEYVMIYPDKF